MRHMYNTALATSNEPAEAKGDDLTTVVIFTRSLAQYTYSARWLVTFELFAVAEHLFRQGRC